MEPSEGAILLCPRSLLNLWKKQQQFMTDLANIYKM